MALFLRPDIVVWIAEHLGFQHLGLLCRTSRVLRTIVAPSWDVWTVPCQKVWGTSAPWDVFSMRAQDETPLQFARRMVFPWVQPPRKTALGLTDVLNAENTLAWRIQLDQQCRLQVTFQSFPPGSNVPLAWGDEGFPGKYDVVRSLPVRPLCGVSTVLPLSDDERTEWDEYLHDFRGIPYVGYLMRYEVYRESCWRMHTGVVVAVFSDSWHTVPGLGFFAVRDRRLLHFQLLYEDVEPSSEIFLACPGEMWVLDRWVDNNLVYYGMQTM